MFNQRKVTILFTILILNLLFLVGCSKVSETEPSIPTESIQETTLNESADSALSSVPSIEDAPFIEDTSSIEETEPDTLTLGFVGDMNLDENWCTTQYLNTCTNGIRDCLSSNLIELLNSYDIFMLNNEFTYSNRGTPLNGKAYTFRANPERIDIIKELGTDIVLLANNHVYDYGQDAFLDTLDVLSSNQIPYVGAGHNLAEACQPVYFTYDDITIAYVAATRAEKNIMTPEAGVDSPGVLRTYDETKYLEVIQNAKKNADYVIANVHWGTEYSNDAENYQRNLAKEFVDAGADAVIGSHPHVLQGMEYYNGKPIIYSLGNFWFNEKTLYSCVYELQLNKKTASLEAVRFVPCLQKDYRTVWPDDPKLQAKIIKFENDISFDISIDSDGYVTGNQE